MSKKIIFLFMAVLFLSSTAFAQTSQRLRLTKGRGESGPLVATAVRGNLANKSYRDYTFSIPKPRGAEITVETISGETVLFEIISPKKKSIIKDGSEIMDDLPNAGTYTIRVYRTKGSDAGKSAFRLSIWMYI